MRQRVPKEFPGRQKPIGWLALDGSPVRPTYWPQFSVPCAPLPKSRISFLPACETRSLGSHRGRRDSRTKSEVLSRNPRCRERQSVQPFSCAPPALPPQPSSRTLPIFFRSLQLGLTNANCQRLTYSPALNASHNTSKLI